MEHMEERQAENTSFPVAGIGASAGGLEAFRQLLEHLPVDTGMAFVLVQHLDPTHDSILPELLSRSARMPVNEVRDGMRVEPDHVYVIPRNTNMAIAEGVLRLLPREEERGRHRPIDYFLRTLAEDQSYRAIGVILSGTASDGTLGLEAIKAAGGITFAQDTKSAKYDSLPRSAIAAGHVDFILTPQGIAQELARISRHPYVIPPAAATPVEEEAQPIRGSTGAYLEAPSGKATLNLLKMAREGLMLPLRAAIQKAKKNDATIRTEGVRVNGDGEFRQVNLEVVPIKGLTAPERCFLVLFEPAPSPQSTPGQKTQPREEQAGRTKRKTEDRQVTRLQEELAATREYMQSLVEQQEAANEELQSSSEEIQSSNEELQSINEELETAKEELESSNEELATLNEELHNRNLERRKTRRGAGIRCACGLTRRWTTGLTAR